MKKLLILIIAIATISTALFCGKDAATRNATTTGSGGSLARFAIAGNYLYMVDKTDLKVFSLVNPGNPVLVNTTEIGFEIETIYPFKDKLFIGSTSVVHIFSIDDPEHPQKLSTAISPQVLRRCDPVVAKDTVAYATLNTNGPCGGIQSILAVYDIHDINNPVQKTAIPVSNPSGLGYADSALYVCDYNYLRVYSINDAYAPEQRTSVVRQQEVFMDVIPYDNTLICWTDRGLLLYNITDRMNPTLITSID